MYYIELWGEKYNKTINKVSVAVVGQHVRLRRQSMSCFMDLERPIGDYYPISKRAGVG